MKSPRHHLNPSLSVEALEDRRLLAVDLLAGNILHIQGAAGNDDIFVRESAGKLVITVNGVVSRFDISEIHSLQIDGFDGDDAINVHPNLLLDSEIRGGGGRDEIRGGAGIDLVHAGTGDDFVVGRDGDDQIFGDDGDDVIRAGSGNDVVRGGPGADWLLGEEGDDVLLAGVGNDISRGGPGHDTLEGEEGDDRLYGDSGSDEIHGGGGNDVIRGGLDDDTINGNDGDDIIFGSEGDDQLYGDFGADRLFGDAGIDEMQGGGGNDVIRGGPDNDTIIGNEDDDTLIGNGGDDQLFGGFGADWLFGKDDSDELEGGDGPDRLYGEGGDDVLRAGDGDDVARGGPGDDILEGEEGDDRLFGDSGVDKINGGGGNDVIRGGLHSDTINGNDGDDLILGDEGDDQLFGGAGADRLYGKQDNDELQGGDGEDRLFGNEGLDDLQGGSGDDLLRGGDGDDRLDGEGGRDNLSGGAGTDVLIGQIGDDDRLDPGDGTDELQWIDPFDPDPNASDGILIGAAEIMALPMSGPAWEQLKDAALDELEEPDLSDRKKEGVQAIAKALYYARTGDVARALEVRNAIEQVMGTEGNDALATMRGLQSWIISADLIDLRAFDPDLDRTFREWLRLLLDPNHLVGTRSLVGTNEDRPNNWGLHAGASRAAAAIYLGDESELARTAAVFKGYLGDRDSYADFDYGELSWQADADNPVGVNPAGATIDGHSVDGVLPDDQRRAGSFSWPPPLTNYAWEALQGVLVQAIILDRAGFDDVWNWQDRAILRAVEWLYEEVNFPAEGDDEWQIHVINYYYGTDYAAAVPARTGKGMGWTDWTHGNP